MTRAYYNEHDPFAAEWLRMLIACGHIADGDVDTRSIEDVRPNDLNGYTQVHLFAGIGGWSRAFRLAGVPDSSPLWSCSCPCQPFSAAGKGDGFSDERHLWPSAFHLITQREPQRVFGEQVAAKAALEWLDVVCSDLEAAGYTVGAKDLCAASIGAAHIRQRLYWSANANINGCESWRIAGTAVGQGNPSDSNSCALIDPNANGSRCGEGRTSKEGDGRGSAREQPAGLCIAGISDNAILSRSEGHGGNVSNSGKPGWLSEEQTRSVAASGATRGFWSPADWWYGRDEKYRPIESGLFPLAHGVPKRMGRLRGYGNAIVPQVAAEFVRASLCG